MDQIYNIIEHGNLLEKEAAEFIAQKLPHYERVWSLFIGNRGNATKADLPGYSDDEKRSHFAENSYTALESLFMIQEILDSGIFMKAITSFALYKEFNTAFISFFAHVGRSLDMMKKNSTLLKCNERPFPEDVRKYKEGI